MRPLKLQLQSSFRAHDLVQKHEVVDVGHRFGKVSLLATMPGNFYSRKLEWTLNESIEVQRSISPNQLELNWSSYRSFCMQLAR